MLTNLTREFTLSNPSDSFADKSWYVFYTAPRAEKVAKKELENREYEVYLPMTKSLRVWKNRQKKLIDVVLFPSYIFVRTEQHCLYDICQIPKIVTYIRCGNSPSKVQDKDIEGVKKILSVGTGVTVENDLQVGGHVRVVFGPLAGYKGLLVDKKGKTKFGIQLHAINHTVLIDINVSSLQKESKQEVYVKSIP